LVLWATTRHSDKSVKLTALNPSVEVPVLEVEKGVEALKEVKERDLEPSDIPLDDYEKMLRRIKIVQRACGQLCNASLRRTPSKYFDNVRVPVNCEGMFREKLIDAPRYLC